MPAIKATANTSGSLLFSLASGGPFKAAIDGLKVDNQSINDEKLQLYDCFTTDGSKANSDGSTQNAEDFQAIVASGKLRHQMTVPAGTFQSLGQEDLKEIDLMGDVYLVGSVTTSDCVVVAQYHLK
jgi:hypothetical protein